MIQCTFLRRAVVVATLMIGGATVAGAQGWNYPAFQLPTASLREFNLAVADGGAPGTMFVFQWREALAAGNQFNLDVGYADPESGDNRLVLGGGFATQLMRARADLPLDMLLTVGAYVALGNGDPLVRIPGGVSIGHRFPLQGGLALTPFVHPRLSLDVCGDCGVGNDSDTELGLNFDVGVNMEVTPNLGLRFAAMFGGSDLLGDDDAFGISLAWTPATLRR